MEVDHRSSKFNFRTLRFRLSSWYFRSVLDNIELFLILSTELSNTTLDKSTAVILLPVIVVMFGHPHDCVLLLATNSLLHSLHLTDTICFHLTSLIWEILDSNQ